MNEQTIITTGFVVVVFGAAFISLIKDFTGKRTCCGTEKVKCHRKKLRNIAGKVVFHVDGMHCSHCKTSVEKAINLFEGLAGKVSLENNTLTVSYEQNAKVEEDKIVAVLGNLGFTAKLNVN